ncbi:MAG TPA: flavin reductase family protein, partial [Phycisphaerae bacterium]|nr:flavin reductase family protein [Phycisphaerae bacterium]HRW55569.1 flavin reductase family protein [Phycisphaerae bacterium]
MYIDLANTEHSWRAMHRLYLSFVQPRPIALASTLSADGRPNLAPFSFYNMMSANPPVVLFCPAINRHGNKKDTLANIEATGEFVIATVTEPIAERMNICSTEFPHGESEFERSGLTSAPANKVRAMLVQESPVNIECRLRQVVSLGTGSGGGQVVFGDIVAVHVDDSVLSDGDMTCDAAKLKAVGRMGGNLYSRTTDLFSLESLRDPADFAARGPAKIEG